MGVVGDVGLVGRGAEVAAVDQEALLAALQLQGQLRERDVGDEVEGVADPALDRVGSASRLEADRLVGRTAQVGTRSGSGLSEERR